ncbi:hypothetical protein MesoLjLc_51880 [Mesorhizobium sp. L-8-10]|uniref:hypothetical protein n=1 Tax=Mesorhizobium sp. L-8-10 TaxID=2744523 RepID=UPI001927EE14|nr:hypothetical protein [Mesorhizobium sp. L-8-10]BCH33258.1 hypothetical protein MesoLjLc_51880 [Mesorhizobium sp. L-8-10]
MKGWAIEERGEILVTTVSPHRIAAIVNWLVVSQGMIVMQGTPDAAIESCFADRAGPAEAEAVEVTISRVMRSSGSPKAGVHLSAIDLGEETANA